MKVDVGNAGARGGNLIALIMQEIILFLALRIPTEVPTISATPAEG
jgi:hypothetical protein